MAGCSKDEPIEVRNLTPKITVSNGLTDFQTPQDAMNVLHGSINCVDLSELGLYETQMGYHSIGYASDCAYESFDSAKFNTEALLWEYFNGNASYLDTMRYEDGELGIEPMYYKTPMRYLANEAGMFCIGDSLYKLFTEGYIVTDKSNKSTLEYATELSFTELLIDTSYRYYGYGSESFEVKNDETEEVSHDACMPKAVDFFISKTSGRNRLNVEVSQVAFSNPYFVTCSLFLKVVPKLRNLGIWCCATRTIRCSYSATYHGLKDDQWEPISDGGNQEGKGTKLKVYFAPYTWSKITEKKGAVHYQTVDVEGYTYSAGTVSGHISK